MVTAERIPITKDIIDTLTAHRDRTNVAPIALFRGKRHTKPEGLHSHHIYSWIRGKTKTARKDHLDYVLREWAKLPDVKHTRRRSGKLYTKNYVEITKPDLEELRKFRDLAFTPSMILKDNDAAPDGLTAGIISSWLIGSTTKAQPHYLEFVLGAYRKLENHPQRPVIVDDKITAEFAAYIEESGIGSINLLKARKDIPSGLSSSIINRWVSGHAATARKDHLEYVRKCYRRHVKNMPTAHQCDDNVLMASEIVDTMKAHRQRTGVDEKALLKGDKNKPEGLTSLTILNWLRGKCQTAPKSHLEYVMGKWESLPGKSEFPLKPLDGPPEGYVEISEGALKTLRYYHECAFLPDAIFRLSDNIPSALSAHIISDWISGKTTITLPGLLSFVLEACHKLEEHPKRPVVIEHATLAEFKDYEDQTGLKPAELLKGRYDVPQGLCVNVINRWLNKTDKVARKDHLDYVRDLYKRRIGAYKIWVFT